jgi:hypothetical protein
LPETVTVIRPHHPLYGKELKVFGQMQRKGICYLVLVLPDNSRTLIPAAWTNATMEQEETKPGLSTLSTAASYRDLNRARIVVDSLYPFTKCGEKNFCEGGIFD